MATKKQKREAGEARARIQAEESRLSGLRAQKKDRDRREALAKKAMTEAKRAHDKQEHIKAAQIILAASEHANVV